MAISRTSRTGVPPATVTMSGRGTITSRTTVSPNSMIEWMRARSSCSMTSSCWATSAIASSSSSEMNGPSLRPLPGMMTLARPIRPRERTRSGQKRTRAATGRPARRAARSACWIAQVFGAASAITKMMQTSMPVAMTTPHGPKRSARKPTRVAVTSWQVSSTSRMGFSHRSGCSVRRTRVGAPRLPSSSRARALTRLIRVSAVSDMARKPVNAIRTTIATTSPSITGASVVGSGLTPGPVPPESGDLPPSLRCSSIGKANTSVGPSSPRKRSLRSAMACSSTNSIESSASPFTPSAAITSLARRTQRMVSTGSSFCSSAAKTSIAMSAVRAVLLVGVDDVLHDLVADDVARVEVHEAEAVDAAQHLVEAHEAAASTGNIDLGHVAGDDGPGTEPDAGQEHLHLLGRGVLGLVEDDEAVVQRPATHIGQGRHLDRASLEQALGPLELEHVVEGVVEGAEVGVDLGHEVAGQEPEALARFDGGTGEDDAVHLLVLQRLHTEGDGQVGLAGARRANHERDDVVPDGVGVVLLAAGLGADSASPGRAQNLGGEDLRRPLVGLHHVDGASDVDAVEHVALFEQQHQLVDQRADARRVRAFDGDLVAADKGLGVERCLDEPEKLVALPEEPHHEVVLGLDLDLSLGHGVLIQRTRQTTAEKRGCHPGGQPNRFPPRTCRCRWRTELRASSPTLNTNR